MESSLKDKTVRGASWSFIDNFVTIGITFVVSIILARILSPEEFGLIGIITIFISVFNSIVDCGFSSALIRKTNIRNIDYSTIFIFNIVFSVLLAALLCVCSPLIANYFGQTELDLLLKIMSVIVIINGVSIVQNTILVRNIDFKTQARNSLIASFISGVVSIVLALFGFGVWSLAIQQILKQLINSIMLWGFTTWRPKFEFSVSSFKEQFSFGWKLLMSGIIDTIWNEIYTVVIGKCYSAATLGQYSKSVQFKNLFSNNLTFIVQRVYYPMLSSIKDDYDKLLEISRRVTKATMFVAIMLMLFVSATSDEIILTLIGDKWLDAAKYLRIISLYGMLFPLQSMNLDLLKVKGRSDIHLYLEIAKKIIGIGPIMLGVLINIEAMLWGSVIYNVINFFLNSYFVGREMGYTSVLQIRDLMPSFILGALMYACVYSVSFMPFAPFIVLSIQIIVFISVILLIGESFNVNAYVEVKELLIYYYNKFKK